MTDGLQNLRVLELGGGVSAPMAGKLLADLGATVVKIEPPGGEPARRRGPFPGNRYDPEASGTFLYLNANKRSVTLDLAAPDDRAALEGLVREADLLVHNLPPAGMSATGLDYDRFSALNPRLVMLSITSFGLTGPYKDFPADDLTLMHAGGWGYICPGGEPPPDRPPVKPFGQHVLTQAGLHGAVVALAACMEAARSGRGEHVDLSVQEVVAVLIGRHFSYASYTGKPEDWRAPPPYEPYSFYPAKDGYVYLIAPEQAQWERLVEVMGSPDWAMDERFRTRPGREKYRHEIKAALSAWTAEHGEEEMYHAWQKVRVGAAPVYRYGQIEREPHLEAREFFVQQEQPGLGSVRVPGAPYKLRQPWWSLRRPAPALGEANGELGSPAALLGGGRPAPASSSDGIGGRLPLEGVRVLDLSWVWAGPHCTQMLGFLGAEVLKVENSKRLDLTRRSHIFPPEMERGNNRCGYFNAINQNKRSVGIDLARPEGIELIHRLAVRSDVMISNFGTGVLEKLGLGPDVMQGLNPGLIVAMISAFGQTGPCRGYSGYGPLIPPLAGIAAQTGYAEDGVPQDVGIAYGDPTGGVYAAVAILAALWARRGQDAPGQVIDVAMWETMICTGFEGWMNHALGNPPHAPMGNRDPVDAPHNVYRCAGEDAFIAIAVTGEAQWQGLCRALGRSDWAGDPALAAPAGRKAREEALDREIAAWCAQREPWDAARALLAAGVPAFPSLDVNTLVADPHLQARGCMTNFPHAEVGVRTLMGAPWQFAHAPNGRGKAAPLLGEDTDAVLGNLLGLDTAELARLREAGVIE